MAFVVPKKNGAWEIRESRSTPDGPRSKTLATFRELDREVIGRALARTHGALDAESLERAALRAGAPVAEPPADRAARALMGEIEAGRRPRRALRQLLSGALGGGRSDISASARSIGEWVAATPAERGETLRQLLLLADALPQKRRSDHNTFPPFRPA